MLALLLLLVVLGLAAAGGAVHAVVTDGYGPRRDRADRYARTKPI